MPNVPWSSYSSTRLDADKQRCLNLFPHTKGGFRQFPGIVDFATFSTPQHVQSESVFSTPFALCFNNTGTVLTTCQGGAREIRYYTLSTAWDISTVDSGTVLDLGGGAGIGSLSDARWVNNGSNLFVLDDDQKLHSYSASVAYDITSLAYDSASFDCSTQITSINDEGFDVSTDGTRIIVTNTTALFQYNLTTPFDLSTCSYSSKTISISGSVSNASGVRSDPSGKILSVTDLTNDDITQFLLGSPFDLSTLNTTPIATFSFASQAGSGAGYSMEWGDDGSKFYIPIDTGSGAIFAQYSTGGYSLYNSSSVSGAGTALITMQGVLYGVIGGNLYSFSEGGGTTLIGAVAAATGIATDGTYIVITTGGQPFAYDATNGIQSITDADLLDAKTVAYVDSQFIFDQPDGQFSTSALGDPTDISSLDTATAEAEGDDVVAVYAHEQRAYICGSETIELWDTTGVGRPPLDRQDVIERGIVGPRAIDSNDARIYFLDQFRRPNVMKVSQYENIASAALGEEWDTYSTVSDCIVSCYTLGQENFVQFRFGAENKCWTYHEMSQTWCERQDPNGDAFDIATFEQAYNKTFGIDASTGTIYEFSPTAYQDDGSNITRSVDTDIITSELLGAPNRNMIINELDITIDASGSGSVTVEISKDGGAFGSSRTITVTEGVKRYRLFQFGMCREAIFRFTTTSNIRLDYVGFPSIEGEVLDG